MVAAEFMRGTATADPGGRVPTPWACYSLARPLGRRGQNAAAAPRTEIEYHASLPSRHRCRAVVLGSRWKGPRRRDHRAPIPPGLIEDERNTIEVFRRCSQSVVYVTNNAVRRDMFTADVVEVPQGSGSGFIWDIRGHVVTNFHVVQNGAAFSVALADGKHYDAELVGVEPFRTSPCCS